MSEAYGMSKRKQSSGHISQVSKKRGKHQSYSDTSPGVDDDESFVSNSAPPCIKRASSGNGLVDLMNAAVESEENDMGFSIMPAQQSGEPIPAYPVQSGDVVTGTVIQMPSSALTTLEQDSTGPSNVPTIRRSSSGNNIVDIDIPDAPSEGAAPDASPAGEWVNNQNRATRRLKLIDQTVHRVDQHVREGKEMVVSNLRSFFVKVQVTDNAGSNLHEGEISLQANLLYENGRAVEQLATCEPLLVGTTEVITCQGVAQFKLRITSLSSHREKQRFRIQITPKEASLQQQEPGLSLVTSPMKCVTKLRHTKASTAMNGGHPLHQPQSLANNDQKNSCEKIESNASSIPSVSGTGDFAALLKMYEGTIGRHGDDILQLQQTNNLILEEMKNLRLLIQGANEDKVKNTANTD